MGIEKGYRRRSSSLREGKNLDRVERMSVGETYSRTWGWIMERLFATRIAIENTTLLFQGRM
ncbi:MAG TPA: hypothetical protein DCP63_01280 [Bacteroidetes bacterium]|nr:hypothetical protein [Bacteroidota bacterium]